MKSFKRYLKEEVNPPGVSDYFFFRQFMMYNLVNDGGIAPGLMFRNVNMGDVGGGGNPGENQGYPMFPMANAPQPFLDLFDYNGDGIIGYNDMTLVTRMFEIMDELFPPGGEGPPSGLPSASWYLENWESFNQEYGVDLPDPSSWFFSTNNDGELFFEPDSQLPANSGKIDYGGFENGLYEWNGSVGDYFNIFKTMRGWRSFGIPWQNFPENDTYGVVPAELLQQYFPDFYEWLMQMDYANDGLFHSGSGPGAIGIGTGSFLIFQYAIDVILRYYNLLSDYSGEFDSEYLLNRPFEEVNALQGYDGLNQFIQTLFLTGDKTQGLFNLPDGFQNSPLGYLVLIYGFGFDPNYGQVPTPPEETPIAQDPYQITQLPTPENP